MWLYLLSLLTIGSVQSLTITYPYRPLVAFDPIRAKIPNLTTAQGFLVYLDDTGVERIVAYNYAEPVYAIRRISYISSETPLVQRLMADESTDNIKAREAHFRVWALHQYQILKNEIDMLKEEGKEPSIEMKLKFVPLEKIALTQDFSTIADLPEIQSIRQEHFNVWKQIDLSNQEQDQVNGINNLKTPLSADLSKSEIQIHEKPNNTKSNIMLLLKGDKSVMELINSNKVLDKFNKDNQEINFANKIDIDSENQTNESSKTIESTSKIQAPVKTADDGAPKTTKENNFKQSLHTSKELNKELKDINNLSTKSPLLEGLQPLADVPEVKKSADDRETESEKELIQSVSEKKTQPKLETVKLLDEHSLNTTTIPNSSEFKAKDVVNMIEIAEASRESTIDKEHPNIELQISKQTNLKKDNETLDQIESLEKVIDKSSERPHNLVTEETGKTNAQKKVQSEVEKFISTAPTVYVPQQVVDTDEVIRARNEHLNIVKEALKKAKIAQLQILQQPEIVTELLPIVSNGTKGEEGTGYVDQENGMN